MNLSEPQKQLGGALGRIPSGLFVVTVRRGDAETGMLASWIQQCSFNPPQITVAVNAEREILGWLEPGCRFTVNILDASQTDMIVHFGRGFAPGQPAFEGLDIERPTDSGPVLAEALAYLECEVVKRHQAGDHVMLVALIQSGRVLSDGQPMVHVRKSGFHY